MTSKVKRDALGIHEPVYGRLTADMLVPPGAADHGGRADPPARRAGARAPRRTADPPGADVAAVLAAIDAVYPAIEVVDSRYAEPFRLPDSVADNAGAARVVLGDRPRKPGELVDLHVLGCVFRCRGGVRHRRGRRRHGPPGRRAGLAGRRAGRARRPASSRAPSCSPAGSPPRCRCGAGERLTAEFDGLGSVEVRGG